VSLDIKLKEFLIDCLLGYVMVKEGIVFMQSINDNFVRNLDKQYDHQPLTTICQNIKKLQSLASES
jgi:hypothetical protein